MPIQNKITVSEAHQWYKNGDHPLDYAKDEYGIDGNCIRVFTGDERKANKWEGSIVRYYRTPSLDGGSVCKHCGNIMHVHGWIDVSDGGHVVCPGDWIITGEKGEIFPCKPDVFELTYEVKT